MLYEPRPAFEGFHHRENRWSVIVAHRRAGKTVAAVLDLVTAALSCTRHRPQFFYIGPLLKQAKAIAWNYLVDLTEGIRADKSEVELKVWLPNGAMIQIGGADNPDSWRGNYADGVVIDEMGDIKPSMWGEVVRPMLSDRLGFAVFIGTPKGRNMFYDLHRTAQEEPGWFHLVLKASETGIIPEEELEDARRTMTAEAYAQEYECEFDVPVIGAIYREQLTAAYEQGRVDDFPYDPQYPVDTYWDLGILDPTSILFGQFNRRLNRTVFIDYFEGVGQGLAHYAKVLQTKPYVYGKHFGPHDISVRDYGSGQTRIETARQLGIRFETKGDGRQSVTPNVGIEEGIQACITHFPLCYFDQRNCADLLEALKNYRREYVEEAGTYRSKPVHNWASHGADAFRVWGLNYGQVQGAGWLPDESHIPPSMRQRKGKGGHPVATRLRQMQDTDWMV